MATYHLRVKDDTKRSGSKVSPIRHADYILREEGQAHADYINREARLKSFSQRRLVTRTKVIAGTKK